MFRIVSLLVIALALSACGKGPAASQKGASKNAPAPILLAAEDLHTIRASARAAGPAITGTIRPERRADLRAEVSASVLRVLKENGDAVKRGDLLVQLDDTSIRDSLGSAEAAS